METALRRLALAVLLLLVVSALTFSLVSLSPGDPAVLILGQDATAHQYKQLDHQLGIDRPVIEQYWSWLVHAVHGDLGTSLLNGQSVAQQIRSRIPTTLSVLILSVLFTAVVGFALGTASALSESWVGKIANRIAVLGFALPPFWIGPILVLIFAVKLPWLPAIGYTPLTDSPVGWIINLILPVATLVIGSSAVIAKQARDAIMSAQESPFVIATRARGMSERKIFLSHIVRNASVPVVAVIGLEFVGLLSGDVIIESVFSLPGLGTLAITAAEQHDFPVIEGVVVVFALIVVVINSAIDGLTLWLDPRGRKS